MDLFISRHQNARKPAETLQLIMLSRSNNLHYPLHKHAGAGERSEIPARRADTQTHRQKHAFRWVNKFFQRDLQPHLNFYSLTEKCWPLDWMDWSLHAEICTIKVRNEQNCLHFERVKKKVFYRKWVRVSEFELCNFLSSVVSETEWKQPQTRYKWFSLIFLLFIHSSVLWSLMSTWYIEEVKCVLPSTLNFVTRRFATGRSHIAITRRRTCSTDAFTPNGRSCQFMSVTTPLAARC